MVVICFGAIRGSLLEICDYPRFQVWDWSSGIKLAVRIENS
jgi:hypothetical protein